LIVNQSSQVLWRLREKEMIGAKKIYLGKRWANEKVTEKRQ
jgi:hypothetical protein